MSCFTFACRYRKQLRKQSIILNIVVRALRNLWRIQVWMLYYRRPMEVHCYYLTFGTPGTTLVLVKTEGIMVFSHWLWRVMNASLHSVWFRRLRNKVFARRAAIETEVAGFMIKIRILNTFRTPSTIIMLASLCKVGRSKNIIFYATKLQPLILY